MMNTVMGLMLRNKCRWRKVENMMKLHQKGEVHSRHEVERVKRALRKLHTNLGHPVVKEMVRVLKHGLASELAIQEARRMHCDICAENVQPKLPRPATPRQVLNFNERVGLDISSLSAMERFNEIGEMFVHRMSWNCVSDDHSAVVGDDGSACETCVARDPKQAVLDLAGEILHDILLDPLELNSVKTEMTAAESPWQAGITEAKGRAFKMVFKKMLDSTQPGDKRII